jgi:hypothetical protein
MKHTIYPNVAGTVVERVNFLMRLNEKNKK